MPRYWPTGAVIGPRPVPGGGRGWAAARQLPLVRHAERMLRTVAAHLECDVLEPARLVLAVAAAGGPDSADDVLAVSVDGRSLPLVELADEHGTRLHVVDQAPPGALVVDYTATLGGSSTFVDPDTAALLPSAVFP